MDASWTTSQVIVIGVACGCGGLLLGAGCALHWAATTLFGRRGGGR
jgi:hypothetical protein